MKTNIKLISVIVFVGTGIFTTQLFLCAYRVFEKETKHFEQSRQSIDCHTQNVMLNSNLSAANEVNKRFFKIPLLQMVSCLSNPGSDAKWKMFFVIKSAVGHVQAREIIRRTWASVSYVEGYRFASVFVVGKTNGKQQALVDEEYKRYGDILQVNISDEYRFIAQKTLGGMQWVTENLSDDVFYTSCDDDFMIDLAGLVDVMQWHQKMVKKEGWSDFPIICSYKTRIEDGRDRNNKSKYYVSNNEYKWPYYPDYCLGGAYTTSVGVVRQLVDASRGVTPLKMDDVWITGILREKIGMPRQYIRKLDNPVATHHNGFKDAFKTKKRRKQMQDKWEALRTKLDNLKTCTCPATWQ